LTALRGLATLNRSDPRRPEILDGGALRRDPRAGRALPSGAPGRPEAPGGAIILSTDCGFGRERLARRIAFYKRVAITLGANLARRELGLPQAPVLAADPRFA
jgi:hypothetical protein